MLWPYPLQPVYLRAFRAAIVNSTKLNMFSNPGANQCKRQHQWPAPCLRQHLARKIIAIAGISNETQFNSGRQIMPGLVYIKLI